MTITNQNPEIQVVDTGNTKEIKFGDIKKGTKKQVSFLVENAEFEKQRISCTACTNAEHTKTENGFNYTITYSGNVKGGVDKQVDLHLKGGEKIIFRIKGTVK